MLVWVAEMENDCAAQLLEGTTEGRAIKELTEEKASSAARVTTFRLNPLLYPS